MKAGDELRDIAVALGADAQADVYLGRAASEGRVKSLDLSRRRVLAVATHGLLAGDLDRLHQPALALSSPLPGEADDGLLTVDEILGLRLDADWAVLSAWFMGRLHHSTLDRPHSGCGVPSDGRLRVGGLKFEEDSICETVQDPGFISL